MGHVIRRAGPQDAPALAALHLVVWEETYAGLMPQRILDERRSRPEAERVARWRERVTWARGATWVAELAGAGDGARDGARDGRDAGRLTGFVSAGRGRHGDERLELMALYVLARHHGTGLGHRLLTTAIGEEPAYLWVLDGNARAIGFYERHGFAFDGAAENEPEGRHRRMVRPAPGAGGTGVASGARAD